MKLHDLYPFASERQQKKRRGRGPSSGLGCTAGKGHKGQRARAGGGPAPGFEGGQMPLVRRLPKRGFTNIFRSEYVAINIEDVLRAFPEQEEIGLDEVMQCAGKKQPVKILARGEVSRKVKVTAHKFSRQAVAKIESAGGEAVALEG